MKTHKDGSRPLDGEIFVFGSNLAGRHGLGAAKAARKYYGAIYGQGIGLQGSSYGIPTKDLFIKTLNLPVIKKHVSDFVQFTNDNPDTSFFITRIGCGLAGYKDDQIAPMFLGLGDNCSIPEQWEKYLNLKSKSKE
jgi:hypothetical protein